MFVFYEQMVIKVLKGAAFLVIVLLMFLGTIKAAL